MQPSRRLRHEEIPIKALVGDVGDSARVLREALAREALVLEVREAATVTEIEDALQDVNTIFIDPLALGLEEASSLIFRVRTELPEVVFVLYVDNSLVEQRRSAFFRGDRRRFAHYYTLDKRTPMALFPQEVRAVLRTCRSDLSWRMSAGALERLRREAERIDQRPAAVPSQEALAEIRALLEQLTAASPQGRPAGARGAADGNAVFLSHRFEEREYVDGLSALLEGEGFDVVTGRSAESYISQAVLDRIRECEYFLCLMTRSGQKEDGTFTTSAWVIEEKGAAIALGKRLVLLVEEGVTDIGGLQGDWQQIRFGAKGFTTAALSAVKQLKQYAGRA